MWGPLNMAYSSSRASFHTTFKKVEVVVETRMDDLFGTCADYCVLLIHTWCTTYYIKTLTEIYIKLRYVDDRYFYRYY